MAAVLLGVTLGLAGAIYLYVARPIFWWDLGALLVQKCGPWVVQQFLKLFARMSPEEEAEWHQAIREGRSDEWMRERGRKHGKSYPDK